MDATIADAPLLLTARGGVAATNRDPFVTGDMNASLTWDGRAKATGVSCEQNETCSRGVKNVEGDELCEQMGDSEWALGGRQHGGEEGRRRTLSWNADVGDDKTAVERV